MTEEVTRYYISDIIAQTCAVFGAMPEVITGKSQRRTHYRPRAAVAYLARKMTPLSMPQIGKHMNGRDHSTVGHAIERASLFIATDTDYRLMVEEIEARVRNAPADIYAAAEKRRREAEERAERAAQVAAEKAKREHWIRMAAGNKAFATRLRRRAEAVANITCTAKPKNNFQTTDAPDDGHAFHAAVAGKSLTFLDKLLTAGGHYRWNAAA